jgi:hypothetical protein
MLHTHFSTPPSTTRAITVVHRSDDPKHRLLWVSDLLDPMGAEDLALARCIQYRCGHCNGVVNLRVLSVAAAGTTSGKRAHFAHAAGQGAGCPAVTPDAMRASDLGAAFFNGRQEGARHLRLKHLFLQAAVADPTVAHAALEVPLAQDGARRRPDVLVDFGDASVSFDVQVAPPMRDTISGRARFYEQNHLLHVWALDGAALERTQLQAFQDLTWRSGGQVLAFDEGCYVKSIQSSSLTMKQVVITDAGDTITAEWRWLQGRALVEVLGVVTPASGMAGDLLAQAVFAHLAAPDRNRLKIWYQAMSADLGLPDWTAFTKDGLRPLLGALASLHAGRVCDGSNFAPDAIGAVVNNALASEVFDKRHLWAPVLKAALEAQGGRKAALTGPKTQAVLTRAMAGHDATEFQNRMDRWWPLIQRLFPKLPKP